MRNILLAIVVAVLPVSSAVAEQPGSQKPDKSATSGILPPVKGAGVGNSCAAYGSGFVKVEGTETCVKVGGAVSIGAGISSERR
jgi:Porin subfamily